MKILDKYVAKNFLVGYAVAFCVLIGLRIIIDLFVNIDEFAESADLGTLVVIRSILTYYALNSTLYFRDFAGMITVVAAAFSFGKMVRSSELVAVMASGVSLKRVIGPVVVLALLLTGLLIIDQELVIPPLAPKLVRTHDEAIPGQEWYNVWFMRDGNGSLICSRRFDVDSATLHDPTIILRQKKPGSEPVEWESIGVIKAGKATYNYATKKWDLTTYNPDTEQWDMKGVLIDRDSRKPAEPIATYDSGGLVPRDVPVMRRSQHKSLLSSRQLADLARQETQIKDMAQLWSQKHFRITDPVINLVMLMISLPILVCRDPKSMKSAVMISFGTTAACFVTTFVCKILATEVVFGRVMPQFWAWLPVFIFLPIAFIEFDSMKT